jgi:VanZ family protein
MFFKYNIPGLLWAIIIMILLGLPGSDLPDTSFINIPYFDKIVHAGLFGILVFLLARGFCLQNQFEYLRKYFVMLSLMMSICYGGLTEILQSTIFVERATDIFDFFADAVGSGIGIFFFLYYRKKFLTKKVVIS